MPNNRKNPQAKPAANTRAKQKRASQLATTNLPVSHAKSGKTNPPVSHAKAGKTNPPVPHVKPGKGSKPLNQPRKQFEISIATHADFGKITLLASLLFTRPRLAWGGGNVYFVCFGDEGDLAGFSHLIVRGSNAILQGVGVNPVYRKRGLGTKLVAAACEYALSHGIAHVILKVKQGNATAIGL
ncbi:MAG TPA: GNAT family N-acetyltransferase, partial [Candidatus Micrarchaeota archaeon]|nr:GNAT family N-acetyltransferase [Candidatus Micrarchaeota archaeon]